MGQLGALPDFSGDKLWLSGCLERAGDEAECNSFHSCWTRGFHLGQLCSKICEATGHTRQGRQGGGKLGPCGDG